MSDRKPNVGKPSLRTLSFVLRNKELWPADFKWNFSDCDHCAIGIAHRLWKDRMPVASIDGMMTAFGISHNDAIGIFAERARSMTGPPWSDVSPDRVADRIDAYLAEVEA